MHLPGKCRSFHNNLMHRFCFIVAFVLSLRVGEATNPGPDNTWTLGVVNPTGIGGKGYQCSKLSSGVFGVSESHLTRPGLNRFRQELRSCSSSFSYLAGHPAPFKQRGIGCIGGKNTGVGFLSTVPSRALDCEWNQELFETSRVQAASFYTGSSWILGGVVYGYASKVDTTDIRTLTNDLLSELCNHIKPEQHGLKFIGGDFNQLPNVLPAVRYLQDLGWVDVQDLAYRRWNIAPSHTCSHCTRKDFLLLSPALQEFVVSVSNQYDFFPDHSILTAKLINPTNSPKAFTWYKPKPLHQLKHQVQDEFAMQHQLVDNLDQTDLYASICESYEKSADAQLRASNLPGLSSCQRGRGKTLCRKPVEHFVSPVKPPRQGEPTSFDCKTIMHKRWFVQLRRLLNYKRLAYSTQESFTIREHKLSLWHSILRAPGFSKSFQHWWPSRAIRSENAPLLIPTVPPDGATAKLIYDNFEKEFRHWESIMQKNRKESITNRYQADVNAIFSDIQKPAKVPVEVLVAKQNCTVAKVVDPLQIEVDHPPDPGNNLLVHTSNSKHWVEIQSSEPNKVAFQQPHELQQGDTLAFAEHIGDVNKIHEAFESTWSKRWDKHRGVSQDHWEVVEDFIQTAVPRYQMTHTKFDLRTWKKVVQRKRHRAASGLDGITRLDLQLMNDILQQRMLDIFETAEQTDVWPDQMLEGGVFNLAKVDNAEGVNDFRPITILPLPYRCWASHRARNILKFLEDKVPTGLKGNMPGQSSVALWYQLQSRIEDAHYTEEHISGCVTDLIKAFNLLPRDPIFCVARKIGIDPGILRAWQGAIGKIRRRFFVRMQPSQGVTSATGFPEGDPLSVTAMALANIVIHMLLAQRHPASELQTYVDNIEILDNSAIAVTNAFNSLKDFCWLLDIEVDEKKTYMWSTSSHSRKELATTDHHVAHSARDLGGHMQYSAYKTNVTVRSKCEALQELWPKLNRSPAPREHKLRALAAVAWAGSLHGCATVHMNHTIYEKMRSGAMQAIFRSRGGANPHIQFALIENTRCDPEYYSLWATVLAFRRYSIPEIAIRTLAIASQVPPRKRKPGPGGVLLSRLEAIGWCFVHNSTFVDIHKMPIDIMQTPIQELKFRVQRAWQQFVGSPVCSRKGFHGLQLVDVPLSKIDSSQFSRDAKGALVALQNGTFCTNDFHLGDTDKCKFCQAPDSLTQRHWHCPATQESRSQLDWDIQVIGPGLPECTRDRGWFLEPQEVRNFKASLVSIPNTVFDPLPIPETFRQHDTLDLFTDGTAISPDVPMARLAAWGVILAPSTPEGTGFPIASGGIPGYWQTVGRAEITAFIAALYIAVSCQKPCRVWCDNQHVVETARAIQLSQITVTNCMSDHDLWSIVEDLIRQHNHDLRIIKIGSHQDSDIAEDWQAWAFKFNDMADSLATSAVSMLPSSVVYNQQQALEAINKQIRLRKYIHEHFARVAMLSVVVPNPKSEGPQDCVIPHDTLVLDFSHIADLAHTSAPNNFRFQGWMTCIQWMKSLTTSGTETPVVYVSWYELLWVFQLQTGKRGIHSISRHNNWALDNERNEYDAIRNAHQLSRWLTHLIQLGHPTWKPIHAKPSNSIFQNWMMCVAMRWNPQARDLLAKFLQESRQGSQFHKIHNDIGAMPVATSARTPSLVQPTSGLHRFGFCRTFEGHHG